jgi:CDP-glycerol glycerophosphotransferase
MGRADARYAVRLAKDEATRTPAVPIEASASGAFTAQIPCRAETGAAIASGSWVLEMIESCGEHHTARRVPVDERLLPRFPLLAMTKQSGIRCTRTRDAALRIQFDPPYGLEERGRLGRRRIHIFFDSGEPAELDPSVVVLESFAGKNASDSVHAIYQELRRRQPAWQYYWSVATLLTPVPEGTQPLLRHTRHWAETVRSAQYLINNANFPFYFRKQAGQIYVQTWHGTPLKKVGLDVPPANLSLSYRALMIREAQYWDYLLAQNAFAANRLPVAFGYKGPMVDTGYPRNDALLPDSDQRAAIRSRIGLKPGHLVVLYAPTWRDNLRNESGQYALVDYLDFGAALRRLDDVTFLVRAHPNTVSSAAGNPAVINVSSYPDINDLILAADVLVTDYSSVMFDFCVTGRPILFLVPDLETYRDKTRGFYLDLEEIAPGPVCRTSDDLLFELSRLETYRHRYANAYADFTRRFAPHDDGSATSRVVDAIWGPAA